MWLAAGESNDELPDLGLRNSGPSPWSSLNAPGKVWMIGSDAKIDIAGAAAVGIPGILVGYSHAEVRYGYLMITGVEQIIHAVA
jgi:FMN phosphatase YigB (HAD superfamily)